LELTVRFSVSALFECISIFKDFQAYHEQTRKFSKKNRKRKRRRRSPANEDGNDGDDGDGGAPLGAKKTKKGLLIDKARKEMNEEMRGIAEAIGQPSDDGIGDGIKAMAEALRGGSTQQDLDLMNIRTTRIDQLTRISRELPEGDAKGKITKGLEDLSTRILNELCD